MDEADVGLITLFVGIVVFFIAVVYGLAWFGTGLTIGQTYNTVGTIELYEHSSWCGENTWVVLQTLGGVQAEFTLVGYHEFNLGSTYEIKTTCERGGYLRLSNWYRVESIDIL